MVAENEILELIIRPNYSRFVKLDLTFFSRKQSSQ